MAEHEEARRLADKIQAALRYYVPGGENRKAALDAVGGLLALLSKAEQERDEAQKAWAAETKRATENGRLAQTQYDRAEAAERELERLREALQTIASDGKSYAPCLPECVEGPPTCGCAETRAERALSADTQREDG